MDRISEIIQLILLLLHVGHHDHNDDCSHTKLAVRLAPVIVEVFEEDAMLAVRIVAMESTFRWGAVSSKGAMGYMGINPVGMASVVCKGLRYRTNERDHFQCGRQLMQYYQQKCGTKDPLRWLSPYNGLRYCRPSTYSRRVLKER